jgi:hypothetical protein
VLDSCAPGLVACVRLRFRVFLRGWELFAKIPAALDSDSFAAKRNGKHYLQPDSRLGRRHRTIYVDGEFRKPATQCDSREQFHRFGCTHGDP